MDSREKYKKKNRIGVAWLSGILISGLIVGGANCQQAKNGSEGDAALLAIAAGFHPTIGFSARASTTNGTTDANGITLTDGSGNTLVLSRVEIVISKVEMESEQGELDCDDSNATQSDCEELETGPFVVDLPLDGPPAIEFAVPVAPGVYDQVEFDIHRATADDDHITTVQPQLTDHSILVIGSYNGSPFQFVSNLEIEQEKDLNPPLEIASGVTSVNLTLDVNPDGWFLDGGNNLIDPTTANAGGPNETMVSNNILNSMTAYEDDNFDGRDDHSP